MNFKQPENSDLISTVLPHFNLNGDILKIEKWGVGLINSTWKISSGQKSFILQKVNSAVFKDPTVIAHNIALISDFLKTHHPDYLFAAPQKTLSNKEIITIPPFGVFRLFTFIPNSITYTVVDSPQIAFEAAAQFGKFTKSLLGIELIHLKETIPDFHNLHLRYNQYVHAIKYANEKRKVAAGEWISRLETHKTIATDFLQIQRNPAFKKRVTHHDTKISNVLFDKNGMGLCVIDLDTVMPGYFISDVGDMMRTYLCPVSEEEKDFSKILVREAYYKAIVQGYCSEMGNELTEEEKQHFYYAGKFSIYMQALRFLTDFLNNDIYYGASYPNHNLIRAANQITLLERFSELAHSF